MRVISAYLLAVLGGNESPKAEDITSILSSVGIEAESDKVEMLLKEVEGKSVDDIISAGVGKLASVGGGGGGGGGGSGGGGGGGASAAAAEETKEEEPEEEEEDDDMGFSLFD